MAFNNSLTERLDQLRSRNQNNRMHSENSTGQNTPFRYSGSFMTSQAPTPTETPNLQRRFTTDLSKMQQLAPIGQQPNQTLGGLDMSATVRYTVLLWQLLDTKKDSRFTLHWI